MKKFVGFMLACSVITASYAMEDGNKGKGSVEIEIKGIEIYQKLVAFINNDNISDNKKDKITKSTFNAVGINDRDALLINNFQLTKKNKVLLDLSEQKKKAAKTEAFVKAFEMSMNGMVIQDGQFVVYKKPMNEYFKKHVLPSKIKEKETVIAAKEREISQLKTTLQNTEKEKTNFEKQLGNLRTSLQDNQDNYNISLFRQRWGFGFAGCLIGASMILSYPYLCTGLAKLQKAQEFLKH